MKKIFRNKICHWLFGILPPFIGVGVANYFSNKSREKGASTVEKFYGEENEWLIIYCKEVMKKEQFDYFIFGHRHLPIDFTLNNKSRYINLGDWINYNSYAVFNGDTAQLLYYKK